MIFLNIESIAEAQMMSIFEESLVIIVIRILCPNWVSHLCLT